MNISGVSGSSVHYEDEFNNYPSQSVEWAIRSRHLDQVDKRKMTREIIDAKLISVGAPDLRLSA